VKIAHRFMIAGTVVLIIGLALTIIGLVR